MDTQPLKLSRAPDVLKGYARPHSIEAEQSVIGAMILEGAAIDIAREIISADDFYREAHKELFKALSSLRDKDVGIDLITLQEELRRAGAFDTVGGMGYLTSLLDTVPTASHVAHYAAIVQQKAVLRRLIDAAIHVLSMASMPDIEDVGDVLSKAQDIFYEVVEAGQGRTTTATLSEAIQEVTDELEERAAMAPGAIVGLSTGINALDDVLNGLQGGHMIVVAARPSMGKTTLCLDIAEHVAVFENRTVIIYSLEVSAREVAMKFLSSGANIPQSALRRAVFADRHDWSRLTDYVSRRRKAPLLIDDASEQTVVELRSKTRRLHSRLKGSGNPLGLVVIDYLQLLRSGKKLGDLRQDVGEVSRSLHGMAQELSVPVVAVAQLSRAVDARADKRPVLSDLRETGQIEQDADVVLFLYRDSYYKGGVLLEGGVDQSEIIVAKNRFGGRCMLRVGFIPAVTRFVEIAQYSQPRPEQ